MLKRCNEVQFISEHEIRPKISTLLLTSEEKMEAEYVRTKYREKFACHYIPDINNIRQKIEVATNPKKVQRLCRAVKSLATIFAYETFQKPNSIEAYIAKTQNNIETILPISLLQAHFQFPVFVDKCTLDNLTFQNGTFFADCEFSYYILIPKQDQAEIDNFISRNYKLMGEYEDQLKIGQFISLIVPFNNSDEFFFFCKHFFLYFIYSILKECERNKNLLLGVINELTVFLEQMYRGFYCIEKQIPSYTINSQINSYHTTRLYYDKYIFSKVREFQQNSSKILVFYAICRFYYLN